MRGNGYWLRQVVLVVFGAVLVLGGILGYVVVRQAQSISAVAPSAAFTPAAPSAPPGLRITVTGTNDPSYSCVGCYTADITVDVNNQEAQYTGVNLPWTYSLPNWRPGYPATVMATDDSGMPGVTETCSIVIGGRINATETSSGAYSSVTCDGG